MGTSATDPKSSKNILRRLKRELGWSLTFGTRMSGTSPRCTPKLVMKCKLLGKQRRRAQKLKPHVPDFSWKSQTFFYQTSATSLVMFEPLSGRPPKVTSKALLSQFHYLRISGFVVPTYKSRRCQNSCVFCSLHFLQSLRNTLVTPAPPHTRQKYEQTSGQNMTPNASKQGKFGSLGAILSFIQSASKRCHLNKNYFRII